MSEPVVDPFPWAFIRDVGTWIAAIGIAIIGFFIRDKLKSVERRIAHVDGRVEGLDLVKADKAQCTKDNDDLEGRMRFLEAERAEVKLLASSVGNLGALVERLTQTTNDHHSQNRKDAAEDRRITEDYRTNIMAPILKQLGEQSAENSADIRSLKERDEDKEQRLRDLEQRPRRSKP